MIPKACWARIAHPRTPARVARLLLLLAAATSLHAAPAAAATCDLAPPHQNPILATPDAFSATAKAVNKNFSETAGSRRDYDLIDGLDGVTLGFGNWPQQEVRGFFADMASASRGAALSSLEACLADVFARSPTAWSALEAKAGMAASPPDVANVSQALAATVLSDRFMARYSRHCMARCKPGEPNFFVEQQAWFVPAMGYAFRDRAVIAWQVDFWSRTIVADAISAAAKLGFSNDEAAVVAVAAYRSSSPAWLSLISAAARTGGTIRFNGHAWNWSQPPQGASGMDWLRRWRLLILWQVYANNVQVAQRARSGSWSFRDRSRLYYRDYLESWWVLPALDQHGAPDWRSAMNLDPTLAKPAIGAAAARGIPARRER